MLTGTSYYNHPIYFPMNFFERLRHQSQVMLLSESIAAVMVLCYLDFITGYDVSLQVFYTVPVIFAVCFCGKAQGLGIAFLSVLAWFLADVAAGHIYLQAWVAAWNFSVRFSYLVLVVYGANAARFQLQKSHAEIKSLQEVLHVCTGCKKICDEAGYWAEIETYLSDHSSAQPMPKLCPECSRRSFMKRVAPEEGHVLQKPKQISP